MTCWWLRSEVSVVTFKLLCVGLSRSMAEWALPSRRRRASSVPAVLPGGSSSGWPPRDGNAMPSKCSG
eukprot:12434807-Alexandrium_andersonii.AAC.1